MRWQSTALAVLAASIPLRAQAGQGVEPARVIAVLEAEQLDQAAFLAVVDAGAEAAPTLLAAIGDPADEAAIAVRRRLRALRALRLIGPAVADMAVPTLMASLSRDMQRDDVELLDTLRCLAPGVQDRERLDLLLQACSLPAPKPQLDMARFRRWCAKMRLWYDFRQRLDWRSNGDVQALIADLHGEDANRRRFAAEHLGRLGEAAVAALPELVEASTRKDHPRVTRLTGVGSMTTDFYELIQAEAAVAVARIAPSRAEARRGLALLLSADDPRERFAALLAMAPAPHAEAFDVVPAVLAATSDDDARIAAEAVTTLARLGDGRAEVLARLGQCQQSADEGIARRATAALRTLR